uniref:Uncharacterized protein n=1 Tax=Anguilla anguilla TaxID=7936 RepID=A0A0E9R0X8_ANGAN
MSGKYIKVQYLVGFIRKNCQACMLDVFQSHTELEASVLSVSFGQLDPFASEEETLE